MQLENIDWNKLWQEAQQRKSWKKKKKSDWDRRAHGFAGRNVNSDYANRFLQLVKPESHWRVLDIGCGPGTLALPLAAKVRSVTAIDFSSAMLQELEKRSTLQNIVNIRTVQASWTDDWRRLAIPPHEVVISSRSLSVTDLRGALEKMDNWATEKVFIVDRVGSGPFDPGLFAALKRDFEPGPDYIFTVNLLYQMGIHPTIDYIELEKTRSFASREEAIASCRWMFDDLGPEDEARLVSYVNERIVRDVHGAWSFRRESRVKWALLSWEKRKD